MAEPRLNEASDFKSISPSSTPDVLLPCQRTDDKGQKRRFDRLPMTSGLPSATGLGEMRERVRLATSANPAIPSFD
jgi:hypothetical protein